MADSRNPRPALPSASARAPSLQIDTLRVRIPGQDRSAGHAFARELSNRLAGLEPSLLAGAAGRSLQLGTLRLSLPAERAASAASATGDAIESSILRALRAAQRGSGGAG